MSRSTASLCTRCGRAPVACHSSCSMLPVYESWLSTRSTRAGEVRGVIRLFSQYAAVNSVPCPRNTPTSSAMHAGSAALCRENEGMEQLDGTPAIAADLRALAFAGLGHFTTMRVESGGVRGLGLHLARLVHDSRALFDAELDLDVVRARIRSAIADEPAVVLVRVTVFDPALTLERPGADAAPRILVSPRPASTG